MMKELDEFLMKCSILKMKNNQLRFLEEILLTRMSLEFPSTQFQGRESTSEA